MWNGDGKDAFTAEQWLVKIEKARQASGWHDQNTMSFICCHLRGEALLWYNVLKRSGIKDTSTCSKPLFLHLLPQLVQPQSVNLHNVKQNAHESIVQFYSRVIKALNDLEALLPATTRIHAAAAYPNALIALDGFAALPATDRQVRFGNHHCYESH